LLICNHSIAQAGAQMTSSTKPEVHDMSIAIAMPPDENQATATVNIAKNWVSSAVRVGYFTR